MNKNKKVSIVKAIILSLVISVFPILNMPRANAATITNRKLALSTSLGDATGVTYSLTTGALLSNTTAVKSVEVKFCSAPSGTCNLPSGFANNLSTLASQPTGLGAVSGWTVSTSTPGSLRILNAANVTNPSGSVAITWNLVHNPTAANVTFYGVITTFSDSAWTTAIDSDGIAVSTAGQITVNAAIDETLTFTLATATVALGTLSTSTTGASTSSMTASTNAATGYSITYSGNTLTSGTNTITPMATATGSVQNSKQFGINLMANGTPSVGTNTTGTGTATPYTGYGAANTFKFLTGDTIASVNIPSNSNTFTTSYIANIDALTAGGNYSTVITYVITANF